MSTPTNPWFDTLPGPRLQEAINALGPTLMERYHTDDVYFAVWLHTVNRAVQRRVGLSFDDLEDWGYRDAYDAGQSPKEAALEMLEDNGYDVENVAVIY